MCVCVCGADVLVKVKTESVDSEILALSEHPNIDIRGKVSNMHNVHVHVHV